MALPASSVVVPGQRITTPNQSAMRAGDGTYTRDGAVYASIAGTCSIADGIVTVSRANKPMGSAHVLRLNDIVLCKVMKVTTRQVMVDIVCVRDTVLQEVFPGTIRLEDVRTHDVDKLVMEDKFSPGMLVKAVVLSFGDTRSYFLSTARPGLGVVQAVREHATGEDVDMN